MHSINVGIILVDSFFFFPPNHWRWRNKWSWGKSLNLEVGEASEVLIDLEEWEDGKKQNVQKEVSRKGEKHCWDERPRPKSHRNWQNYAARKGKMREKKGEHYEQLSSSKYISSDMMLEQSSAKFQHCFLKPVKKKA